MWVRKSWRHIAPLAVIFSLEACVKADEPPVPVPTSQPQLSSPQGANDAPIKMGNWLEITETILIMEVKVRSCWYVLANEYVGGKSLTPMMEPDAIGGQRQICDRG